MTFAGKWRAATTAWLDTARDRIGRLGTNATAPVGSVPAPAPSAVSPSSPSRIAPDGFDLPAGFAELRLSDQDGHAFTLVRSEPPTAYEQGFVAGQDWGTRDVVWLLRKCLGETGVLVDVGANIGAVSFPVAVAGTPVIAIEMLPSNCVKQQLAALLNPHASVRLFQAGVSSSDGLLRFGGSEAWGAVGQGQETAVALRLSTILKLAMAENRQLAGRPLVMKIDVEGHELEVLRGALDVIRRERPIILFESIELADGGPDQVAKQCKHLLQEEGYGLYVQRHHVLVPRAPEDFQESLVVDFLAVPPERAAALHGMEVRRLSAEERAAWIAELTQGPDELHQWHAAAATAAFQREDPGHAELVKPLLAALGASPYPKVSGFARGAANGT